MFYNGDKYQCFQLINLTLFDFNIIAQLVLDWPFKKLRLIRKNVHERKVIWNSVNNQKVKEENIYRCSSCCHHCEVLNDEYNCFIIVSLKYWTLSMICTFSFWSLHILSFIYFARNGLLIASHISDQLETRITCGSHIC